MAPLTVLVIEDRPSDARLTRFAIESTRWGSFRVVHADRLSSARDVLARERIDAIVTDLGLPDSVGLDTVRALREAAPDKPLVVLTVDDDPELAAAALAAGALDHHAKSRLDGDGLGRAIRYAMLRQQLDDERATLRAKEIELEALKEVEAVRRNLVMLIAHGLRTPMTPLVLWLELLTDLMPDDASPEHREALENAKRSSDRLRRLIEDVVLAANATQGKIPIRPRSVELHALIAHAIAEQEPTATARGIQVVPKLHAPLEVKADPDQIHNVMHAIISNAIKFSRERGIVEVSASREGERVALAVRDEGEGIPREALTSLFQPFGVHDATQMRADARGLGLYLARLVVEGHGGRIWAESEGLGAGATIRIELPAGGPTHA